MMRNFLLPMLMLSVVTVKAQDYHAIQGSPYAGSLGVHNNPASILMTPYKWDLTLFGVQGKSTTNFFTIYNYSLLSNVGKSQYKLDEGDKKRFTSFSFNLNLLNARVALNRTSAIAFGVNIKSTSNLKTSSYNYNDTLLGSGDFFKINNPGNEYSGKVTSASWAEIYATYSRTIIDNDAQRLNAGITVKVNKGLSGAYANFASGRFQQTGDNRYTVNSGVLEYAYSSNYDQVKKTNPSSTNVNNFLKFTEGGVSFDAGVEYLVKPMVVKNYSDEDDYYDYEWKIGASLLDAGFTQYAYSAQSRLVSNINPGVSNVQLDDKFDSTINTVERFNDSMATIAGSFSAIIGKFRVVNPMRIVLNVDRFIYKNFYVNAELSLNVPGSWLKKWKSVKQMNLLTVTPRWEKRNLGFYLPVQVTNTNRFWIGGAVKAGPLLLGFHNWANLFAKTKVQNGGGYLALIIRNPKSIFVKYDKRLDCPTY